MTTTSLFATAMNLLLPSLNFAMSALCQLRDSLRLRRWLVIGARPTRASRGMFRHFSLMLVELKFVYTRSTNLESLDVSRLIFGHCDPLPSLKKMQPFLSLVTSSIWILRLIRLLDTANEASV
jgi:hypothetical protein